MKLSNIFLTGLLAGVWILGISAVFMISVYTLVGLVLLLESILNYLI